MGIFGPNIKKMRKKCDVHGLINALKHSDIKVRRDAATALGEIRDKHAVEPLIDALKDSDADVRGDATYVLNEMAKEYAKEFLHTKNHIKISRYTAAVKIYEELGLKKKVKNIKLQLAKKYENASRYNAAVKIYKELGMENKVNDLKMSLESKIEELLKKNPNIFVEDIKKILSKDKLNKANKLLSEREMDCNKFLELTNKIKGLQKRNPNIFVEDLKQFISKGKFDKVKRILIEKEKEYNRFLKMTDELKDIDTKLTKLSSKLADGEITSEAYENANDNLVRRKRDVEEGLWKIQNKIFREKYEKPF